MYMVHWKISNLKVEVKLDIEKPLRLVDKDDATKVTLTKVVTPMLLFTGTLHELSANYESSFARLVEVDLDVPNIHEYIRDAVTPFATSKQIKDIVKYRTMPPVIAAGRFNQCVDDGYVRNLTKPTAGKIIRQMKEIAEQAGLAAAAEEDA